MFDDFNYPPIMQFFLINLLFGSNEHKVAGKRNKVLKNSGSSKSVPMSKYEK